MTEHTKFPDGFLWGASTSAYQVEGNIENNWSVWERQNAERLASMGDSYWEPWQLERFPEINDPQNYISGAAADHYNRYEEDFDLAKELGHNAHRLSIEWARVEPRKGEFDEAAIEHYRQVIRALRQRNIEPFLTLWHWTVPKWISEEGGWENRQTIDHFLLYAQKMIVALKDEGVTFWMPLNEPGTFVGMSYIQGAFPPQKRLALLDANRVFKHLMRAYRECYHLIHKHIPEAQVGMSHYATHMIPYEGRLMNRFLVWVLDYIRNWRFLNSIDDVNDFIGIQYYHTDYLTWSPLGGGKWGIVDVKNPRDPQKDSDLGWLIYPEGLYPILKRAARYDKPIYITENGVADRDDRLREGFIREHLRQILRAIDEGVPVRGYIYWSLLDNFEWDKGYWPRFGLVAVDYATQSRRIRPSAQAFKSIIEQNAVDMPSGESQK